VWGGGGRWRRGWREWWCCGWPKRGEGGGQAALRGRAAHDRSEKVSPVQAVSPIHLITSIVAGARGEASEHVLQGVVCHACDEAQTRGGSTGGRGARVVIVVVVVAAVAARERHLAKLGHRAQARTERERGEGGGQAALRGRVFCARHIQKSQVRTSRQSHTPDNQHSRRCTR